MTKRARAVVKAKAEKIWTATRAAKRDFDAAHRKGMAALKRPDYAALGDAIDRERKAIESLPKVEKPQAKKR